MKLWLRTCEVLICVTWCSVCCNTLCKHKKKKKPREIFAVLDCILCQLWQLVVLEFSASLLFPNVLPCSMSLSIAPRSVRYPCQKKKKRKLSVVAFYRTSKSSWQVLLEQAGIPMAKGLISRKHLRAVHCGKSELLNMALPPPPFYFYVYDILL